MHRPPHAHSREDEVILVLAGQIVALVGDAVVEVTARSFLLKPSGVMHAFANPGTEPARVYELHAPEGFEEFYAFMHRNSSDPVLTDDDRHASFKENCQDMACPALGHRRRGPGGGWLVSEQRLTDVHGARPSCSSLA
jgi:oxalate decarboxylase/phosphoglucose isomerase-like protein (cupin superfamily)